MDDVSGEILARTVELLLEEGAFDVTVSPFLGKKGRPGQTVRVVCARESMEKFAELLVGETGTLGVKVSEWSRWVVPRKIVTIPVVVGNFRGKIDVKVSKLADGIKIKPEFEQARAIAIREKLPVLRVMELVSEQARSKIPSE